jgi:hypothetical protein
VFAAGVSGDLVVPSGNRPVFQRVRTDLVSSARGRNGRGDQVTTLRDNLRQDPPSDGNSLRRLSRIAGALHSRLTLGRSLQGAGQRKIASRAWLLRVVAHLAVWAPYVYSLARSLQNGWVAASDDSVIALRSWDVLSAHGPLLGQASRFGPRVFDLGPIQYWLQSVPVHIDPGHGVLWGAALWCMVGASLAVEAAWSVGGGYVAVGASAVILGMVLWIPQAAVVPLWNPWFGMVFFFAALAAGWAAIVGHRGWWAVVVIAASIAAQAHLMFAIAAVAIIVVVFIVALADTIRAKGSYRWAVAGTIAGAACWAAPLVQQFTAKTGNMTALFSPPGPPVPKIGLAFGLKALSAAIVPPAYWWQPLDSLGSVAAVEGRSAAFGLAALAVVAAVLLIAVFRLRSRWLAGLAGLDLVLGGAALITYSGIARWRVSTVTGGTYNNLRYLLATMYPLGVLAWLATVCLIVLLGRRALTAWRARAAVSVVRPGVPRAGMRIAAVAIAAVLVIMAAWTSALTNRRQSPESAVMEAVGSASRQIERKVPGQPIFLTVQAPNEHLRRQLTLGLAYALRTKGYKPEISRRWASQLGPMYGFRGRIIPVAAVEFGLKTLAVRVVQDPKSQWWRKVKPRLTGH